MSRHRKEAQEALPTSETGDLLPGAGDLSQNAKPRRGVVGRATWFCRTRPVTAAIFAVFSMVALAVIVAVSHAALHVIGLHESDESLAAVAAAAAAETAANIGAILPNAIVGESAHRDGENSGPKIPGAAVPARISSEKPASGNDPANGNRQAELPGGNMLSWKEGSGMHGARAQDGRMLAAGNQPPNEGESSQSDFQAHQNVAAADALRRVEDNALVDNSVRDSEGSLKDTSDAGQFRAAAGADSGMDESGLLREDAARVHANNVKHISDGGGPIQRSCQRRIGPGRLGSDTELCITDEFYFDIAVDEQALGRIVIGVFGNIVPKSAANFRALATCSGEFADVNLCYKGDTFHRIVPDFVIQGGSKATGRSIYGATFREEQSSEHHSFLSHIEKGAVSWAEYPIGSQMFIMTGRMSPYLDKNHVLFGFVTDGMDVLDRLSKLPVEGDRPTHRVVVMNCGDLHGPATG